MYETFSCVTSDCLCLSRNLPALSKLQNVGHKVACHVLPCAFNVYRACSDAAFSVPEPGDSEGSEGQGGLVCCSPWGRKESDTA